MRLVVCERMMNGDKIKSKKSSKREAKLTRRGEIEKEERIEK